MPNPQSGEGLFDSARALLSKAKGAAGKAADFASGDFVTGARNAVGKVLTEVAGAPATTLFPGEKHAMVLSGPLPKGTSYHWNGPGTAVKRRLAAGGDLAAGINNIDLTAKAHDISYERIKTEFERTGDRPQSARDVRKADDIYMAGVRKNRLDDPKVAATALALFRAKELAEDSGQLDPLKFVAPQIGGRLLKEAKRIRKKKQLAFA
jgi:hypothetical protein